MSEFIGRGRIMAKGIDAEVGLALLILLLAPVLLLIAPFALLARWVLDRLDHH